MKQSGLNSEFVGIREIAEFAGVRPSAVMNWRRRNTRDWPKPVAILACGPIYRLEQIRAWIETRKRQTREKSDLVENEAASLEVEIDWRAEYGEPPLKRKDAIAMLMDSGLKRGTAQELLRMRHGKQWIMHLDPLNRREKLILPMVSDERDGRIPAINEATIKAGAGVAPKAGITS